MSRKTYQLPKLSKAEVEHLLAGLHALDREGVYYGQKKHFDKRQVDLSEILALVLLQAGA